MGKTAGRWVPITNMAGVQPINVADTVQNHKFGTVVRAIDTGSTAYGEGEFVYVKGVASGALNALAGYRAKAGLTTLAVADGNYHLGSMMSTLDATTKFGWLQIKGRAVISCLTALADNAVCYLTSTPGSLDDASVIGDVIHGCVGRNGGTVTVGDLAGEFEINRPWSENRVSLTN